MAQQQNENANGAFTLEDANPPTTSEARRRERRRIAQQIRRATNHNNLQNQLLNEQIESRRNRAWEQQSAHRENQVQIIRSQVTESTSTWRGSTTLTNIPIGQMPELQLNFDGGSSSRRGENAILGNEELDVDEHMDSMQEENAGINSITS